MSCRALFAALTLATALLAQGPAGPGPQPPATGATVDPPRLAISPSGRVQVGSVGPRERKVLTYTFTNTSEAPITLRVGDLSPGVTVFGPALDRPLPAKESAPLTMTLDPTDFVGVQRRNVRLLTDDPKQGQYLLPVEMTVRPDLTVDQERKSFGAVAPHESPQIRFTFTRETGDPLQVRVTSTLPEYLELETIPGTSRAELALTLRPRKIAPGVRLGLETLQVETNAPHQPRFTLYLDWKLRHPVEAVPSRLVFLEAKDRRMELKLSRPDGRAFRIRSAKWEGEGFAHDPLPTTTGKLHILRIQRRADREAKGTLILKFDGEDEPLRVPVAYLPGDDPAPAK